MNCRDCKSWFRLSPSQFDYDVTCGKCLVVEVYTSEDSICNAWEPSASAETIDEIKELRTQIARLQAENEQLRLGIIDIARLEAENDRLRRGITDETVPEKFEENIAELQKMMSEGFQNEDAEEFFRNVRSGDYPYPSEAQA